MSIITEAGKVFEEIEQLTVAVVGDVMLDTYWWGKVDRISPEAPVPVVAVHKKECRLGGAGNVALNTIALGATTVMFSVVGNDADGEKLIDLANDHGIDTSFIIRSSERITTNKTRIMSRNQQMMRLDDEITTNLLPADEQALVQSFATYVAAGKPSVVIFEDYNKGVLTPRVITELLELCRSLGITTAVDPKRNNFFAYQGVTIFKPNLKEVYDGLDIQAQAITPGFLHGVHQQLERQLHHQISLITLSEKGIFFCQNDVAEMYPTHVRHVADVSGAGDTVIATASLVYAATQNIRLAATIANIAAGIVCEEVGTVAINRQQLLEKCTAAM